jgi:hypothetical protein
MKVFQKSDIILKLLHLGVCKMTSMKQMPDGLIELYNNCHNKEHGKIGHLKNKFEGKEKKWLGVIVTICSLSFISL